MPNTAHPLRLVGVAACCLALAACDVQDGRYTTDANSKASKPVATKIVAAQDVQVIEGQPNRTFTVIGPIDITVNKLTALHPNPTREQVVVALQKAAAEMGADAIVAVQISGAKVVPMSWGARQGTGTAVRF